MVLPAMLAGAGLSAGLGYLGGQQAQANEDYQRSIEKSLEAQFRAAYQNDPLMNMILGSLSKVEGAAFDPEQVYKQGLEQLGFVRMRRGFDAQRSMAELGFGGPGSDQEQFAQTALDRRQGQEKQMIRSTVDQAAIQARPDELLANWLAFAQPLGQYMQTGAQLGALGQLAPEGGIGAAAGLNIAGSAGGDWTWAGAGQGGQGYQSYIPDYLQGSFFVA